MLLALGMTKPGVGPVSQARFLDCGELRAWYLELPALPEGPNELKQLALRFHEVLANVFAAGTVIPFRFPSIVQTSTELQAFVRKHEQLYGPELTRLGGKGEIRITIPESTSDPGPKPKTGTEYLNRRAAVAERLRKRIEHVVDALPAGTEVKEQARSQSVLLIALVDIGDVALVLKRLRERGFTATGPWPPSDFATCYPQTDTEPA